MKNTKPKFYMTVGLPGSSKSTWAETHKDELNVVIHSSDSIREELFGNANDQSKNTEVFEILHKRIKDDLRAGKNVVYDATNLNRKRRIHMLQNELRDIPCEKVCVLFATPYEMCLARNFARDRQVPDGVMARMYKSFETPCLQEGFDDIQIVWADYKDMQGFEYDIYTDLKKWRKINHNNPHHASTIGYHMIKAYNHYICNYGEIEDHLRWAVLMHDCAKDVCKSYYNSKGEYDPNIAHYYSHENCGAMLSLFYLRELCPNWTDKDILYTSLLINLHMRPYVWVQSEKARQNDLKLFGADIVNDVYILNKCDRFAH